jgi:small conductance mechanosensitive channel
VEAIDLSMTILRTLDDAKVIVPNRRIVGEVIYNYTAERRIPLSVEVAYGSDLALALRTAREVLAENALVLQSPTPEVGIVALGESGIRLALRPWCRAEHYWRVQYEVYGALVERFRERKIAIPYPVREVHMAAAR